MGWTVLVEKAQILAVHAALLHTGKILYFGGDEHDKGQHDANQVDHSRLFDCATSQISVLGSPAHDVFCAGHAFLPDGRLLVAGGTQAFPFTVPGEHHPHFPGLRETSIFDPATNGWAPAARMRPQPGHGTKGGGRWYPTLVTLPSGRVLAMSGHPGSTDTRMNNNCPEAFSAAPKPRGRWSLAGSGGDPAHRVSYYPRLHVLPDGKVFCATPLAVNQRTQSFNPVTRKWTDVAIGPTDPLYAEIASTSVLLPLLPGEGYRPRVLRSGATQPLVIDLGAPAPAWQPTGPRALAGSPLRRHASAVLLPTGDVFVCGGVTDTSDTTAVLTPELYTPSTGAWSTLEPAGVVRNYHSVALLMPDGRVWTAGSNHDAGQSFPSPGVDNREPLAIEIYAPAYVGAPRPQISNAPFSARVGKRFTVRTPQAGQIQRVAVTRAGSATHAFDSDQRYVGLAFTLHGPDELRVQAPPNPKLAPPGFYLLWLLDGAGVPSEGRFIRLRPATG